VFDHDRFYLLLHIPHEFDFLHYPPDSSRTTLPIRRHPDSFLFVSFIYPPDWRYYMTSWQLNLKCIQHCFISLIATVRQRMANMTAKRQMLFRPRNLLTNNVLCKAPARSQLSYNYLQITAKVVGNYIHDNEYRIVFVYIYMV
jgi:hypothetical protein